jgi:hypothetical protein
MASGHFRSWHEAAYQGCPQFGRYWGAGQRLTLNGHRPASHVAVVGADFFSIKLLVRFDMIPFRAWGEGARIRRQ